MLTNIPNQVNLSLLGAGQQMQFWDGSDQAGNGSVNGGAEPGTPAARTGPACRARPASTINGEVPLAFLPGRRGAVTVQGTQTFDTLQFFTDGYALAGSTLLIGPSTGTLNVDGGITIRSTRPSTAPARAWTRLAQVRCPHWR